MMQNFLQRLNADPQSVSFQDTMAIIEQHYNYQPTAFRNGPLSNAPGNNEGSCKLFYFAHLRHLNLLQTLHCFGDYYRRDVLLHPDAADHGNIRQFMVTSWAGIEFDGEPLTQRKQP